MTWVAEDPLPIWLLGALLFTIALVVYLQLRTTWLLVAMGFILLLIAGWTFVERLVLTPREEIALALERVLAAVEANDLPTTLSYLAPSAVEARTDAQSLMPRLEIVKANVTDTPQITLEDSSPPKRATAVFRFLAQATDKQSGMKGGYFDDVQVDFELIDGRWLVSAYSPARSFLDRVRRSANQEILRDLPGH